MNLGIQSILQTISTDLSGLLGSPLAADFQDALQLAGGSGSGTGGAASSLVSDILPVAEDVLPLVAAFL